MQAKENFQISQKKKNAHKNKQQKNVFPSSGLEWINQAMLSIISSEIRATHNCKQLDVEVAN